MTKADTELFIVAARVLRDKGEDIIKDYRANGLTMGTSVNVMAFLKEEEQLRNDMADEGVNAGNVPQLMEDLQRIADIRQQFEELYERIEAMKKGLH
ncbi:MAG: hypothetical protein DI628_05665 [Blastochloris viridis]|uniref:Uncharacterized protein n=1 Tax=Blastochloris viridis TaxID=1079 RepID=A0A6N4R369_BLAVI|nr:MAG: hypothetical protein DI628_05665 [Blastochloris viridis]